MKKFIALIAAMVLTFAFATTCFAAQSPQVTVLPSENTSQGGSTSPISPQTGLPIAGALIATITSAGVALVAKKEME